MKVKKKSLTYIGIRDKLQQRKQPIIKKPNQHYVDNKLLHADLIIYKDKVETAVKENKAKPRLSNYIGECIIKIADNLALMPKFRNYTFIEEMKSDGIENVLQYIDNFDPKKYNNPFAYLTKIIYYAFLRRIAKEKKQLYIKYKTAVNYGIFDAMTNTEANSDTAPFEVYDNLVDFITLFEEKKKDKKDKKDEKIKGLEKFIMEDIL